MRDRIVGLVMIALGVVILVFALWLSRLLPVRFSGWWRGTGAILSVFSVLAGIGILVDKKDKD